MKTVKGVEGKNVLYTADEEGNITPLDFTNTSEKVMYAVVHIKATQTSLMAGDQGMPRELPDPFKQFFGHRFQMPEEGMQQQPGVGSGSGVILNEKGYIVTNDHVIDNAQELEFTLHNNEV